MTPRLRVLELPSQQVGEVFSTPFALVFDRFDDIDGTGITPDAADGFKASTGARGILVFDYEIDLD